MPFAPPSFNPEMSRKKLIATYNILAKIVLKHRAVTKAFSTTTAKYVRRAVNKALSKMPVVPHKEEADLPPVENLSLAPTPVELSQEYGYRQRSFCLKFSDDGKPVIINGCHQKFNVKRVLVDVIKPMKTTYLAHDIELSKGVFNIKVFHHREKIFIHNDAGDFWLRELVKLVASRPDVKIHNFPTKTLGEFSQIIIKPYSKMPMTFLGHQWVSCITIQY